MALALTIKHPEGASLGVEAVVEEGVEALGHVGGGVVAAG